MDQALSHTHTPANKQTSNGGVVGVLPAPPAGGGAGKLSSAATKWKTSSTGRVFRNRLRTARPSGNLICIVTASLDDGGSGARVTDAPQLPASAAAPAAPVEEEEEADEVDEGSDAASAPSELVPPLLTDTGAPPPVLLVAVGSVGASALVAPTATAAAAAAAAAAAEATAASPAPLFTPLSSASSSSSEESLLLSESLLLELLLLLLLLPSSSLSEPIPAGPYASLS